MAASLGTRLKWLSTRRCSFRLSSIDIIAIAVCAASTWLLRDQFGEFVWLVPVTLGHFFLFCNVFRIHRRLELNWAAFFVMNVSAFTAVDRFSWTSILVVQLPVTMAVIALQIRSPRFHGIFCSDIPDQRPTESEIISKPSGTE